MFRVGVPDYMGIVLMLGFWGLAMRWRIVNVLAGGGALVRSVLSSRLLPWDTIAAPSPAGEDRS
jgi:hypothetical protein